MRTLKLLFGLLLLVLLFNTQLLAQPDTPTSYALLFAVDDYGAQSGLDDLENPVKNAKEIALELRERYGFQTEVVVNPTLKVIKDKFEEYKTKFTRGGEFDSEGQLFLFFSGHGVESDELGFFMPSDANVEDAFYTGMAYELWRNRIDAINCKHILVAIDACHSAHFDPQFGSRAERNFNRVGELSESDKILADHLKYNARFFFTSDGKGEETPDNSNFAKKFLEAFRASDSSVDGFMTSSALFANYLKRASPQPGGGSFGKDESGSHFLFFDRKASTGTIDPFVKKEADIAAFSKAKTTNTVEAYQTYLDTYPKGQFRNEARSLQLGLRDKLDWELAQLKNTDGSYQEYLDKHPTGTYKAEASATLIERKKTLFNLAAVEQTPVFPGCENKPDRKSKQQCTNQKIAEFFNKNVQLPTQVKAAGMVAVRFVVETDGSLSNPELAKDVDGGLGAEVMRVAWKLKDEVKAWMPAKQRGQIVRCSYVYPYRFKPN
ncbi:MAG: hypothetical protein Sapg2KO_51430 [Saprospiraceae bacterium]